MAIKTGTEVRQKAPAIEGHITRTKFNESADCLEYLVSYVTADGETHERWFLESEIEVKA